MANTVYVVESYYNNGECYEDAYESTRMIGAFSSVELAKNFIYAVKEENVLDMGFFPNDIDYRPDLYSFGEQEHHDRIYSRNKDSIVPELPIVSQYYLAQKRRYDALDLGKPYMLYTIIAMEIDKIGERNG